MDMKPLSSQSVDALSRLLAETKSELCDLRFQLASHQLSRVHTVRELRKRIANIQRVLRLKK